MPSVPFFGSDDKSDDKDTPKKSESEKPKRKPATKSKSKSKAKSSKSKKTKPNLPSRPTSEAQARVTTRADKQAEKIAPAPSAQSQRHAAARQDPDDKFELTVSQIEDYLRDNPVEGTRVVNRRRVWPLEELPADAPERKEADKLRKDRGGIVDQLRKIVDGPDPVESNKARTALRTLQRD